MSAFATVKNTHLAGQSISRKVQCLGRQDEKAAKKVDLRMREKVDDPSAHCGRDKALVRRD